MMTAMPDAEALFRAYRDRVFRYLYRAAGQVDAAHDLTQEVFLRVTRTTAPAAADGDVAAWLFRIARNMVLDHRRRLGGRQLEPSAGSSNGAARSASQETGAAVNQALAALSDIDRDVFLLREVVGLGYDEIARTCDLTPDAVRNRIHRARLALRERLEAPIAARRIGSIRRRQEDP
jgi:RNA polymerase sigma-70 factor (ECF subfamily)